MRRNNGLRIGYYLEGWGACSYPGKRALVARISLAVLMGLVRAVIFDDGLKYQVLDN